jgi:ABC-type Mn2+/Zn2+ transport system permease subunit
MLNELSVLSIASMVAVAAAAGLVGVFAIMRRMTLAADAISHIALPGLGIAFLVQVNPLVGGAAALLIGAFIIWGIELRTKIATETVTGVIFSASLAIGSILTPEGELIDTLFGDVGKLTSVSAVVGLAAALVVAALVLGLKERLTLALVSDDLARTSGLNVARLNLVYLLLFVGTVLLGLNFLGILLMGSLIIVPAAASKNLAWSFTADLLISPLIAAVSVMAGLLLAAQFDLPLGPAIVSVAAAIFFASLLLRRR